MSVHFTYFLLLDRTTALSSRISCDDRNSLLSVLAKMVGTSLLWSEKHTWNVATATELYTLWILNFI